MGTDEAPDAWTSLVLLERFRGGDELAAEALFARYFERLTSLARSRLSTRLARRTDPEDIVLSVYRSFFVEAREGRYTLGRGGDLWRLLSSITRHKLLRQARHQSADRRSVDAETPARSCRRRKVRPPPIRIPPLKKPSRWPTSWNGSSHSWISSAGACSNSGCKGLQISEIAEDAGRSERSVRRSLAQIRALLAGSTQRCLTKNSNRASSASRRPGASRPVRDRRLPGTSIRAGLSRRDRLLVELICVDLEFRWRNPGARRTGHAGRLRGTFPELISLDRLPLELIGEEYRVRRRWGDGPSPAEFLSRFHERREQIRAELFRVDAEIEEEAAGPATPRNLPYETPLRLDRPIRTRRSSCSRTTTSCCDG